MHGFGQIVGNDARSSGVHKQIDTDLRDCYHPPMISPGQILSDVFGYSAFRGLQEDVVNHIISGNDALVLMPTGGGKSLCYQIPALCLDGLTVVISPLIALMQDQISALNHLGIAAESLNSNMDWDRTKKVMDSIRSGRLKILYISPEKINTDKMQALLKQVKVSLFAVDEAHCISHWGHAFRPEYTGLTVLKNMFPGTPIIALTATADMATRKDILKNLNIPDAKIFISSFDRPNINYAVQTKNNEKRQLL
jgi:ATP-dependent DNA helicase RecQ